MKSDLCRDIHRSDKTCVDNEGTVNMSNNDVSLNQKSDNKLNNKSNDKLDNGLNDDTPMIARTNTGVFGKYSSLILISSIVMMFCMVSALKYQYFYGNNSQKVTVLTEEALDANSKNSSVNKSSDSNAESSTSSKDVLIKKIDKNHE